MDRQVERVWKEVMILGVIEIRLLPACFNGFKWPGSTVESSLLHVQYTEASVHCVLYRIH